MVSHTRAVLCGHGSSPALRRLLNMTTPPSIYRSRSHPWARKQISEGRVADVSDPTCCDFRLQSKPYPELHWVKGPLTLPATRPNMERPLAALSLLPTKGTVDWFGGRETEFAQENWPERQEASVALSEAGLPLSRLFCDVSSSFCQITERSQNLSDEFKVC